MYKLIKKHFYNIILLKLSNMLIAYNKECSEIEQFHNICKKKLDNLRGDDSIAYCKGQIKFAVDEINKINIKIKLIKEIIDIISKA